MLAFVFDLKHLLQPSLEGIPLLILGNKCDVGGSLSAEAIQSRLALETITGRPLVTCLRWLCVHFVTHTPIFSGFARSHSKFSVSAKMGTGLEECLEWLCNRADESKR